MKGPHLTIHDDDNPDHVVGAQLRSKRSHGTITGYHWEAVLAHKERLMELYGTESTKTRTFSIAEHGYEEAYRKACSQRAKWARKRLTPAQKRPPPIKKDLHNWLISIGKLEAK